MSSLVSANASLPSAETVAPVASAPALSTGVVVAGSAGVVICAAELGASLVGAIPGAIVQLVLAAWLVTLFALRPGATYARILPALALVALIRPVSMAATVPSMGPLAAYAMAGLPLLVGAILATRLLASPVAELHLPIDRLAFDLVVEAFGVPAGVAGYLILRPGPLVADHHSVNYLVIAAILFVFGGLLEELVFRGLLQDAAEAVLGGTWRAIAMAASLNAVLYWGSGSVPYMLLMGGVGCVFGLARARGASLWGIALGHGFMLTTMAMTAQQLAR